MWFVVKLHILHYGWAAASLQNRESFTWKYSENTRHGAQTLMTGSTPLLQLHAQYTALRWRGFGLHLVTQAAHGSASGRVVCSCRLGGKCFFLCWTSLCVPGQTLNRFDLCGRGSIPDLLEASPLRNKSSSSFLIQAAAKLSWWSSLQINTGDSLYSYSSSNSCSRTHEGVTLVMFDVMKGRINLSC